MDRADEFGTLRWEGERHRLYGPKGHSAHLEPLHSKLLGELLSHAGSVRRRDELIDAVWGRVYGTDQSLSNAVSTLRKSFRATGVHDIVIETIPKVGYMLLRKEAHGAAKRHVPPSGQPERPHAQILIGALVAGLIALAIVVAVGVANRHERSTIAVRPFADLNTGNGTSLFGESVANGVIGEIERLGLVDIVSRRLSFPANDAGSQAELGTHLLEGSVRREGTKRLIIEARLLEMKTRKVTWSYRVSRPADALLSVQFALARDVSVALGGERIADATPDETARQALHRADLLKQTSHPWDYAKAIELYKKAAAHEPILDEAISGQAYLRAMRAGFGRMKPSEAKRELALAGQLAKQALAANPHNSEALVVIASLAMVKTDYQRAEKMFRRAIAENPYNSSAYSAYGDLLALQGSKEEHLSIMERATSLDPLQTANQYGLAHARLLAGDLAGARMAAEEAVKLDPTHNIARLTVLAVLQESGDMDAIMAQRASLVMLWNREDAKQLGYRPYGMLIALADIMLAPSRAEKIHIVKRFEAERRTGRSEASPVFVAILHAWAGDYDNAAQILTKNGAQGSLLVRHPKLFPTDRAILDRNPGYARMWKSPALKAILAERERFAEASTIPRARRIPLELN